VFGVKTRPKIAIIFEYFKVIQEAPSQLNFGAASEPTQARRLGSKDAKMSKKGADWAKTSRFEKSSP
jgi:hypothetical protein